MIKISENYAIDFDKYNIILQERYEKRDGRGKHAALSGEFAYRDIGYHGNFKSLVNRLVEYEIKLTGEEVTALEELVDRIETLKAEILEVMSSNIQIKKGD